MPIFLEKHVFIKSRFKVKNMVFDIKKNDRKNKII